MNLEHLCESVRTISKQAGAFLLQEFQKFDASKIEYKGLNDVVSFVDRETELIIVKGLQALDSTIGFITEEATLSAYKTGEVPTSGSYWIIDPLDGTTNFIHGVPLFAVSIGLWQDGEIVLGVVYEPNRDECFYAWKNGGAWLNGKRISVSNTIPIQAALLATGFPFAEFSRMDAYLGILNHLMKNTHGLRRMGTAAVDLCYTACGRFQGFFEYNLKPWDVAGGSIIVQEAGGTVNDFKGENGFVFHGQIVASGSVHKDFLQVIHSFWYPS